MGRIGEGAFRDTVYQEVQLQKLPEYPGTTYFEMIKTAYREKNYEEAIKLAKYVLEVFEDEPFITEVPYYLGHSYYAAGDYDLASKQFSTYLKTPGILHFEEIIKVKFEIGKIYAGKTMAPFNSIRQLVRIPLHKKKGIAVFNEIISLVAFSDLAAHSLFYKGELLNAVGEYKEAVDAFESVIRGFGVHELVPQCYLGIAQAYLLEYQFSESKDPEALDLAELNLQRFEKAFPQSELKVSLEQCLVDMKEEYASDLYETGRFYERISKPHAAKMYYDTVLTNFSETKTAPLCQKRLVKLEQASAS